MNSSWTQSGITGSSGVNHDSRTINAGEDELKKETNYKDCLRLSAGVAAIVLAAAGFGPAVAGQQSGASSDADSSAIPGSVELKHPQVEDKWISKWLSVTDKDMPEPVTADVDYGLNPVTGKFVFPKKGQSPDYTEPQRFEGQFDHWDKTTFAKNVDVIAYYPYITSPWWAWNNIVDFDGRRYMYSHDRDFMTVVDITDPANAEVVYRGGSQWGPKGPHGSDYDAWNPGTYFAGVTMAWNDELDKMILVASYEVGRMGTIENKITKPKQVEKIRHYPSLKGFKVYVMNGPLPKDWELIATRTTDRANPDAPIGQQQGCGVVDVAQYSGGKYMIVAAAPDDSYALTEYPTYLCSAGYQVWDMSDPSEPEFVSQITVPGQQADDPASVAAYLKNPRAGNRTSWFGARMPVFLPKTLEEGGDIGFGPMGGLGVYAFDLSDPAEPEVLDHVLTAPEVPGVEFDNVDVSQYERTGYIFSSGYPHTINCSGAYMDIYVINAEDPDDMFVETTLPRPTPPENAPYTSFCQRGASFGPKRSNAIGQPGKWQQGIVPYAFYNAGVQIYDVSNPAEPSIAGYFIPPMVDKSKLPEWALSNQGVWILYTEYDRNIMWAFTAAGVYALSSPLLGEPVMGAPEQPFPHSD